MTVRSRLCIGRSVCLAACLPACGLLAEMLRMTTGVCDDVSLGSGRASVTATRIIDSDIVDDCQAPAGRRSVGLPGRACRHGLTRIRLILISLAALAASGSPAVGQSVTADADISESSHIQVISLRPASRIPTQ